MWKRSNGGDKVLREIKVFVDREKILKKINNSNLVDIEESVEGFIYMLGEEIGQHFLKEVPAVIYERENEKHELIDFEFLGESHDEAGDDSFMEFVIEKADEILQCNDWIILKSMTHTIK